MKQTNDKVFWDTNVLVYCYDKKQSERKIKAQNLSFDLPDIMISTQVMNELAFVLSKKQGLDWDKVADVLQEAGLEKELTSRFKEVQSLETEDKRPYNL